MPTTALVVDSVERRPTANSPEVAKVLPPSPPPEFEVATIKPTDPSMFHDVENTPGSTSQS